MSEAMHSLRLASLQFKQITGGHLPSPVLKKFHAGYPRLARDAVHDHGFAMRCREWIPADRWFCRTKK